MLAFFGKRGEALWHTAQDHNSATFRIYLTDNPVAVTLDRGKSTHTFEPACFDQLYRAHRGLLMPEDPFYNAYITYKTSIDSFFLALSPDETAVLDKLPCNIFQGICCLKNINGYASLVMTNPALALLYANYWHKQIINKGEPLLKPSVNARHDQLLKEIGIKFRPSLLADILSRIDVKTMRDIKSITNLTVVMKDCWYRSTLSNLPVLNAAVLAVLEDPANRSYVNTRFLQSVAESGDMTCSAKLNTLRASKGIKIGVLRSVHDLYTLNNRPVKSGHPVAIDCDTKQTVKVLPSSVKKSRVIKLSSLTTTPDPLKPPYNIYTIEDIEKARVNCLLSLSDVQFDNMAKLANDPAFNIVRPGLMNDAVDVSTEFFVLKEKKLESESFSVSEKQLVDLSESIMHLPDITDDIVDFSAVDSAVDRELPSDGKKGFYLTKHLLLRELVGREVINIILSGRTKSIPLSMVKTLLLGYCLHDTLNRDILFGVKKARNSNNKLLYQNCVMELFYKRLPEFLENEFENYSFYSNIRERFFKCLARLSINHNTRTVFYSAFPKAGTKTVQASECMAKILQLAGKLKMHAVDYNSMLGSIQNLEHVVRRIETVYSWLMLDKNTKEQHELYQKINPPSPVKINSSMHEYFVTEKTQKLSVSLYACKNLLDASKYLLSGDCSEGTAQLRIPAFFVIRIIENGTGSYFGNIYALDLKHNNDRVLLLDRIQIPKHITKSYAMFFETLLNALIEMFQHSTDLDRIILPAEDVSNHSAIQKLYHSYRSGLKSYIADFKHLSEFSSTRNPKFKVFFDKQSTIGNTSR